MAEYLSLLICALILFLNGVDSQPSTTQRTVVACTDPPIVSNANYTTNGLTEGSIVTYSCLPGYRASGSRHRTCRNGIWVSSGSNLYCSVISCNSPPSVSRASYRTSSGSRYTVGAVVTYNCYSGYVINGTSADITCQANRTWTSPLPSCTKRDCGPPPAVSGSNVSYTTTDYYSSAIYTCQRGHNLYNNGYVQRNGQLTVRCLSTGLWGSTPTCQPKNCGLPSNIINGMRYSSGNHKYEDVVTYECNHGYKLHGNDSIVCRDSGTWSVKPECRKVECEAPPKVANATFTLIGKAYYGNSTNYMCFKGFEMTGASMVSCQADGTWTQIPTCSLVDCRTPPSIHFGKHTWTSTTYNSEVDYSCEEGYKLIGVAKIYCNHDGRWTDSPTCELPPGQTAPQSSAQVGSADTDNSALTGLAIACALFGVITLLCLVVLIYKLFIANKTEKLFSYASYKNGDDVINSNM